MNRLEFLTKCLQSGLLLTMPEILKENEFSFIPIYDDFVAGFQYYKGMDLIHSIGAGQSLDLVREPENRYDNQAIAIYWEGQKLGFMPQCNNLIPSALLDAKIPCIATVKAAHKNAAPWETLEFSIALAYPKSFLGVSPSV